MLAVAAGNDVRSLEPLKANRSYPVAPYVPVQLPCGALVTERAGGAPASLRKIPESTALGPNVRSTVIVTVPPAATLIGNDTHAPSRNSPSTALWPLTVMISRRVCLS